MNRTVCTVGRKAHNHRRSALALRTAIHSTPLFENLEGRLLMSSTTNAFADQTVAATRGSAIIMAATTVTKPNAPTNLIVTALSSSSIKFTWTLAGGSETGVKVYKWNGSAWQVAANLGAGATSFTDTGLPANTTQYYTVGAINSAGETDATNWASATTTAATVTRPNTPTNLTATALSSSSIKFAWTLAGGGETGVKVYKWNGSAWQVAANLGAGATSFTDTGLPANTTQYYTVGATNSAGETDATNWASATTTAATVTRPNTPTNLTATALSSSSIKFAWTLTGGNETGVKIYKWNGSAWQVAANLGAGATSFTDTGLPANTTQYYTVGATNSAGETDATNWASATTMAASVSTPVSYTQYDSRWAYDLMGGGGYLKTYGCLVTALATALANKGISVDGQLADPHNLNSWLKNNGGYSGDSMVWTAVPKLSSRITWIARYDGGQSLSAATVRGYVDSGSYAVFAQVRNGTHWVLLTGDNGGTTFTCSDPGYSSASYDYSQITGYGLYKII